jgi:hypothetical protein
MKAFFISLLLVGCSSQYKVPNKYAAQQTIIYSCPQDYIMAETSKGERVCLHTNWRSPSIQPKKIEPPKVNPDTSRFVPKKKKTKKTDTKLSCQETFKAANQCMIKA